MQQLRDHAYERLLISIALHGRTDEFMALPLEAFDHGVSHDIAIQIRKIVSNGSPADPATVSRALFAAHGGVRGGELSKAVLEAFGIGAPGEAAPFYAEKLLKLHNGRNLVLALESIRHQVLYAVDQDDETAMKKAMADAMTAFDEMVSGLAVEPEIPTLEDILNLEETPYDWLVPDLLERTDRLILTGMEGTGKSMLLMQFALTVAAGIHPFTADLLPERPYRTLILDCENSVRQLKKRAAPLTARIDQIRRRHGKEPVAWGDVVKVLNHPEGIEITNSRTLARLHHRLASVSPDLVVAGPLYKMSKQDYRDEQAAKNVTDALDELRVKHQFALITEHHTGHASDGSGIRSVRPIGSSVFLRWPEFGLGLAPADGAEGEHPSVVDVRRWRGGREERFWPFQLKHGGVRGLPWEPTSEYYRMVAGEPM